MIDLLLASPYIFSETDTLTTFQYYQTLHVGVVCSVNSSNKNNSDSEFSKYYVNITITFKI